jgi:hypothetical protein
MKIITVLIAVLLCGCSSMSRPEIAWNVLHVVDVAQTINGPASDPCYRERAPTTRFLIGERPHRDNVIAWGVAASVMHYFAFRWVENSDWPDGVKVALRSIDLTYKGHTVVRNHNAGIRPFGDNVSCVPEPIFRPDAKPWK